MTTSSPLRRLATAVAAAVPAAAVPAAAVLAVVFAAPPAAASDVKIFQTQSEKAFLAGTLEGISIDPLGRLRLADRVQRLTSIDEPFLLSLAAHPRGWVVGTGNAGKVLLVTRGGDVEELFTAEEPEIFAVAADDDGTVWAASSPDGKVYRIAADGSAEEWFDPGETYIWALAHAGDGALLVATGTQGRLFRVAERGLGEVVYDSEDTHLRSLLPLPDGKVLVGTAGEGWIQLLEPAAGGWKVRTLYDAAESEVAALTLAPDGTRYAAVVASEASQIVLTPGASSQPAAGGGDDEDSKSGDGEGSVTVSVNAGGEAPGTPPATGSRRSAYRGPRSEVLKISPTGVVETLWKLDDETVFDLLFQRGKLWVATGLEGKLYAWNGSQMVLEKDVDERQVVALVADDPGPAFATTNAAALFRTTGGTERSGVYTSAALDGDQISRFGTFRWRGEVPRGGSLEVSFRSGISAEPDRTWSAWSPWQRSGGGNGGEVTLDGVPRGRYAQWRARLSAGNGDSPLIYAVELTYRQENLRPRVDSLEVLQPGEILVPANFNPGAQTFEPSSPRPDGIFTTLEASTGRDDVRLKSLWKPGWRTLRWKVTDDNGDELVYRLEVRPAGDAETSGGGTNGGGTTSGDDSWFEIAGDLDDDHHVFDARVLPDGLYRFRLTASDRRDNPNGDALTVERLSEPVVVDHSPPALLAVERAGAGRLRVRVSDAWSPLTEAEVSVDAGGWQKLLPEDQLLDGRGESFLVDAPSAARLVLLRLTDAAYNEVTYDLLPRLAGQGR